MSDETASPTADTETEEPVETDEAREALLASFADALGDGIVGSHIVPGKDLWIRVSTEAWHDAGHVARHRLRARYFGFLSVIDWMPSPFGRSMDSEVDRALEGAAAYADPEGPFETGYAGGETRFQAFARVANVGEPGNYWGVTLKADVPDDSLEIASWTDIYAGADWHEREAWEMFGISFAGHPGLRNLYLPGDFEGNPLRKDFPLLSRLVKPWPGIVDVEPMPTDEDEPTDEAGDAAATDGGGES